MDCHPYTHTHDAMGVAHHPYLFEDARPPNRDENNKGRQCERILAVGHSPHRYLVKWTDHHYNEWEYASDVP
jgi:hypothetical protein